MSSQDDQKEPTDEASNPFSRQLRRYFLPAIIALLVGTILVMLLGPTWGTLVAVIALVFILRVGSQLFGKRSWREENPDMAGEEPCPHCGSLQTDVVERFDEQGREYRQRHCFACDEPIGERL